MRNSLFVPALALLAATQLRCSPADNVEDVAGPLTGVSSSERGIHFQSYVYVPTTATDSDIKTAIARQVKTAIGALRTPMVSLNDRGAQNSLDATKWTRTTLDIVDPTTGTGGTSLGQILRVNYRYDDRAVVSNSLSTRSTVDFVMLADDYTLHATTLKNECSDDATTETDSLWYHYYPQSSLCLTRINSEISAIRSEALAISGTGKVGKKESARWFMPITAQLDAPNLPGKKYSPEYDRLFGVGTSKDKVIVYAFFGVDKDEADPDDLLAQEAMKFLRTMLTAQPNFRPVYTDPFAYLLDIYVGSTKISGVTYQRMVQWIVDRTNYPAEVGTDPVKIDALRRQALSRFTQRFIYWDLPMQVQDSHGSASKVTVEVRWFYGYEDGSPDARQHAQWRYMEAFWYGDVFLYNGHSHFGHGPLEPTLYAPWNFNDRYQVMLVNSCISFNYYHQDFLNMKPGGTANLDMVVNGLPSWVQDGGVATARFLTGLLDGKQHPYSELLDGMRLPLYGDPAYDPMRVADGELDNVFSQSSTPLTITPLAPVYP